MKLLLDENLSSGQLETLRRYGYDAIGVVGVGFAGASDAEVRSFAIETGRVVVTLDADFADIVKFPTAGTPGVIRLKVHPPTEVAIEEAIQRTLETLRHMDLTGCLAVFHKGLVRIRR